MKRVKADVLHCENCHQSKVEPDRIFLWCEYLDTYVGNKDYCCWAEEKEVPEVQNHDPRSDWADEEYHRRKENNR